MSNKNPNCLVVYSIDSCLSKNHKKIEFGKIKSKVKDLGLVPILIGTETVINNDYSEINWDNYYLETISNMTRWMMSCEFIYFQKNAINTPFGKIIYDVIPSSKTILFEDDNDDPANKNGIDNFVGCGTRRGLIEPSISMIRNSF